jgi:predicted transglutaminase-like cysteine proteinase
MSDRRHTSTNGIADKAGIIIALVASVVIALFFGLLLLSSSLPGNTSKTLQNFTTSEELTPGSEFTVQQVQSDALTPISGSGISTLQNIPVTVVRTLTPAIKLPKSTEVTDIIYRTYAWTYKNASWTFQGNFSRAGYDYYRAKPHNRENDYAEYVLSDYDKEMLRGVTQKFRNLGAGNGYSEYDNVMNIAAFVQSMPYTSDKVTTGYDEYPRYPLETLVDNGGDCEDTAILTAALVKELGYGVVLIQLPGHMAIGVEGSDALSGTYYEFNGSRYYYLETAGSGWDLGEVPEEYRNAKATLLPLVQRPRMDMSCGSDLERYDGYLVYLNEQCTLQNIGVGTAKNPRFYVAALAIGRGEGLVWQPDTTLVLNDYPEGATGSAKAMVRIPRNETARIRYYLTGDNFQPVELLSPEFTS